MKNADSELQDDRNKVETRQIKPVSQFSYWVPPTPTILLPTQFLFLDTNLHIAILLLTGPTSNIILELWYLPQACYAKVAEGWEFQPYATLGDIVRGFCHQYGWNNYPGTHTNWLSLENGTLQTYWFCTQSPQRKALHVMVASVGSRLYYYLPLWMACTGGSVTPVGAVSLWRVSKTLVRLLS